MCGQSHFTPALGSCTARPHSTWNLFWVAGMTSCLVWDHGNGDLRSQARVDTVCLK
ncbi:hypothetical protein ACRRTK_004855 [Alexandromys fortis]